MSSRGWELGERLTFLIRATEASWLLVTHGSRTRRYRSTRHEIHFQAWCDGADGSLSGASEWPISDGYFGDTPCAV